MKPLQKAIHIVGSQTLLAAKLKINPSNISQWKANNRPIPPKRAEEISLLTDGEVTPEELRPDYFGEPILAA